MPAHFLGTLLESGQYVWRAKYTEGTSSDGPKDKTLLLEISFPISRLPGYLGGDKLNLDIFRESSPLFFCMEWLKTQRIAPIKVVYGSRTVTVELKL